MNILNCYYPSIMQAMNISHRGDII